MDHVEGMFNGVTKKKNEELQIYYQGWIPDSPKAVFQFLHGVTEHSGMFPHLVKALVDNGYAIYADDHRGHGKSGGTRIYIDYKDQYDEDEKIFNDIIKEKHPDLPVFLAGYSLGSFIAFNFARKWQHLLKGLVLVGTASDVKISLKQKVLLGMGSFLKPQARLPEPLDSKLIYNHQEGWKAYDADPLVTHEPFTAKFTHELIKMWNSVSKHAGEIKIPLLVQCGTEDKIMDAFNANNDEDGFNRIYTMPDKTIKIYQNMAHELYNETKDKREVVLKDLVNWLDAHL
ncbi:MAG: alpha/beta hydrolase [Candidatus Hodarchaeota archaeon]